MVALDLTSDKAIFAYQNVDELYLDSVPWTAVFRQFGDDIKLSIGEKDVNPDDRTAVFEDLKRNLPRIKDREIQTEIIVGLLDHIAKKINLHTKSIDLETFLVLPYGYSSEMLRVFEDAFKVSNSGLKLSYIINECVSAALYFFESSEHYDKIKPDSSGDSICFINAIDAPAKAFVVDYSKRDLLHYVIVRDYGNESDLDFSNKKVVWFGRQELIRASIKAVDFVRSTDKCRVMVAGALILGSRKLKRSYVIEGAFGFGIQVSPDKFYPIIHRQLLVEKPEMPVKRSRAFNIDNITHDVNINLYCGFSDDLSGAIHLETITIRQDQLPDKRCNVVVSIELDTMHSGLFSVAAVPQKFDPIQRRFTVPGWLA